MPTDLKRVLRQLWRSKGVTLAVALTLALCIGANALIFLMLYSLVLKPPPFAEPRQLVEIYNSYPKLGIANFRGNVPQYLDYAKHPELFSGVALYLQTAMTVGDAAGPTRTDSARVTPSFFQMLGVKPVVGRFFNPEFSEPGNSRYAVLAYPYWQAHFASDPGVVGRKITIEELPYTIVGVAPASVQYFATSVALFIPQTWSTQSFDELSRHTKEPRLIGQLFARLRPGITMAQAAARVTAIDLAYYEHASVAYRRYVDGTGAESVVRALQDQHASSNENALYLLQSAALFVLLIGCVNVANLLLARTVAQESELAIRYALGCGRWQIIRQTLLESFSLSLLGGALGLGLGVAGVRVVNRYASALLAYGTRVTPDVSLLAAAFVLAIAVGLLIGGLPALRLARCDFLAGLRHSSRNASMSRGGRAFRSLLASGQFALSLILLVSTGLLVRSLVQVLTIPPGFDVKDVTTARIAMPPVWFRDMARVAHMQDLMLDALRQIPGVGAVGLASNTPMHGRYLMVNLFIYGAGGAAKTSHPVANYLSVSPGYFGALGISILNGRPFDARDDAEQVRSIIIDRRLADLDFPGQDPVGRRMAFDRMPEKDDQWWTIVGVAEMARYNGLDDLSGVPFVYFPIRQEQFLGSSFFVRSRRSADDLIPLIREQILSVTPAVPVYAADSMEDIVASSLDNRKGLLVLLGAFGFVAVTLSAMGIYSVLAFDVSQRTREIGIRGAIGASRRQILALILSQGLRNIGLGLGVGLIGAFFLGRLLMGLLFKVEPYDPLTLGAISFLLTAIGLTASFLPAWRAARVDPVVALRCE